MKNLSTVRQSTPQLVALFLALAASGVAHGQSGIEVISVNTTWTSGSYQLTSLTVKSGATLTVAGGTTLTVSGAVLVTGDSSIVLQSVNNTAQVNGAWAGAGVTISAASVEVDAGSSMVADGQGYAISAGPGGAPTGQSGAGGSYGGLGGSGNGVAALPTYGSAIAPTDLGSGGASLCCGTVGGAGGGALTLTVTGTLTDDGIISANGAVTNGGGGGAGGSLYITTGTLTGSGSIAANGGVSGTSAGDGTGGGGGGRVAVYYTTNSGFNPASVTANGGSTMAPNAGGGTPGAMGTVYILGANNILTVSGNLALPANATLNYASVIINNQGSLTLGNNTTLTAKSITVSGGGNFTIGGGSTVTVSGAFLVTGNSTVVPQSVNNTAEVNTSWQGAGVTINAASFEVDAGSSVVADGQGYAISAGPGGAPANQSGAGGSYGGLGGSGNGYVASAPTYGSTTTPTELGSGGGSSCCNNLGAPGGGALTLTVSGTLTDNGVISANGGATPVGSGGAGGGAGGSLYITTGTLTGSGSMAANGGVSGNGSATGGGGGGGGRIALYYATNSGFNLALVTANGGSTNAINAGAGTPGAAGTVYTLGASTVLTVSDNAVLPPNSNLSYSSVTINNQGSLTLGSNTTLTANSISVSNGGSFTIGGGSNVTVSGAVLVTGNSTIVVQSVNNAAQVNGAWVGAGATLNAASVEVDAGSSIVADGQGYAISAGPGGAPATQSGAGGSYGGLGGDGNQYALAAPTYGSAAAPTALGSGGGSGCCSSVGAPGGGALMLTVSGTLTDNGIISANGAAPPSGSGGTGGGAGGSIFIVANTLAGTGSIAANGGAAGVGSGGGGGGGRIAVYYTTNSGFNQASITANGGITNASMPVYGSAGAAGTVTFSNAPQFLWIEPTNSVLYGAQTLGWISSGIDIANTTVSVIASGPQILTLGTGLGPDSSLTWNTTTVPDGRYELRLIFYDANGNDIQELPRTVVVNNSVVWHSGTIASNQEWTAAQVQGLNGVVVIPSGVTVTIDPGTIVKALPGAGIVVQAGGILNALGTSSSPIVFTTFDDSSVGGDTDFCGDQCDPTQGEWSGISVQGGGQFNTDSNTEILYGEFIAGGTLTGSTSWLGSQQVEVTSTVVVPSGVTLTLQPGTVVKFGPSGGITVQAGGQLIAQGTIGQPIYFTSINDNSVGTVATGSTGTPAPGDWGSIIVSGAGATASFNHVQMLYGGGPPTGQNLIAMIQTGTNAVVTVSNSIIGLAFWNGFWTGSTGGGDTVTITDSVVYGVEDRGIDAWGGTVNVVNDTFDGNNSGIQGHGGTINIANTIVSNSVSTNWGGVDLCGGGTINISYSDVWTSVAGSPNYACMTDPTGTDGNISANPVYVDEAQGNFRLNYGSPAIDAANGTVANYPLTDNLGDPRYNDPLVEPKTGVPDVNGNYPDMGAFEFVQSAVSDIDLTVPSVTGPANAVSGSQVQLTWTDTNTGSGTAVGPWHDAVYLVKDPDTNPVLLLAGEVQVANGVTLGPGQSYSATGTVRVPGAPVGNYRWEVVTNDRGEVFVGQNSANDSGLSLNDVAIDLPALVVGSPALSNSFAAAAQSWWYKIEPGANQTVSVNLALNGSTGATSPGSVQLFVGEGYVPTPQHYDIRQVEWNSPTASLVIPNTSNQTYYVTAYAQSLAGSNTAFTIAASKVQFSLTSVSPATAVDAGSATLTFLGGGFTSSATFQLLGSTGTVYGSSAVFVADSTHADVTFNMNQIQPSGVQGGNVYTAQVIENGVTVSLANALTVTPNGSTSPGTPAGDGSVQVTIESPEEFRTGFPAEVTLNYTNVSGTDLVAPLISLSVTGGTLAPIPPECSGCNTNFPLMYQNAYNSGLVLGINNQGPAGVLPAGAQGSVTFQVTPTAGSGGTVSFTTENIDSALADPLIGHKFLTGSNGLYADAAAMCGAYIPPFANPAGFSRTCMQFLIGSGYTNTPPCDETGQCVNLDGYGVNSLLAADATALSKMGVYESDVTRLIAFELDNDGRELFNQRYHQGAFGFGTSHAFDITAEVYNGFPVVLYPDGGARQFPTINPAQASQYLGKPGDYGVVTVATDGTWTITESNGLMYHFVLDTQANSTSRQLLSYIQDLNGNRLTLTYTNDRVTSVVDTFGNTIAFAYDSLGHIVQATDPEGRVTTYAYTIKSDKLNSTFLTSVTNSNGTTTIAWNEGGPSGVGYFADSCVLTYCEPAIGINTITYPDGTHTYLTYDALGRVASQSNDGSAQTLTFSYGSGGTVTVTDAGGDASQIITGERGNPAQYTDPLGVVIQSTYDPEYKPTAMQGPLGTSYSRSYDSQDNATSQLDPLGNQQNLAFTEFNNPQSFTDALGDATAFAYDSSFDLTGDTGPDGSATETTYDSHGNVTSWTNRRGHTITYTYNANGLLTNMTYANGSQVSYTYDGHRNLLTSTASNGTTSFTYDSEDRLTGVAYPGGKSIQYAYNSGSQLIGTTDSTGFKVNYTYDPVGRLAKLTNGGSALIVSYTYDAAGRLASKTMGNGTSTTYAYDADNNLLHLINYSATHTVLSEFDYTYDAMDRQITMNAPSGAWSFAYDADSELTSVTHPGGSVQYTYDANGNRLTDSGVSYNVNNLNEYTAAGTTAYSYDADGNMISGGGWTYTYDDDNRLIGMASATNTWTYQYDGLGNRVAATHNGVVTQYLNDLAGFGNVEAEFSGSGQLVSHYTYGLDLTSSVPAGGTPAYYHFDGSGNTAQITNASGSVVNSYSYLPFGEKLSSTAGVTNPFTYVGEYGVMDEGSGLYFMRSRWYSPVLGRFVQQDPVGLNGDTDLYRYASNDPLAIVDPNGTDGNVIANASDSAFGHILNFATAVIPSAKPLLGFVAGATSNVGTAGSLVDNVNGRDLGGTVHDTAMMVTRSVGIGADFVAEIAAQYGARKILLKAVPLVNLAGAADELSQLGFYAGFQLYYYTPFTYDPHDEPAILNNVVPRSFYNPPDPPINHSDLPYIGQITVKYDPTAGSLDPNGKLTSGFGDQGFVPPNTPIVYTVYFENQSTATAPAEEVVVSDPLSASLDWSTVQLSQIEFNNVTIDVPSGLQAYTGQVNVSTDPNPVSVKASLNPGTGVLSWTMESIDPTTGGLPANPLAGFLPPNNAGNQGTGYVTFTVQPKSTLANAATITNQATITFDANAAINTNTVTNTMDSVFPISEVAALPADSTPSFLVSWSGSDPGGAGIASYNIYVAIDNGPYSIWMPSTTATSATYTGTTGQKLSFYSMATDNVGNIQQLPGVIQTTTIATKTLATPTVTVTPSASSITTAQALTVTVTISGGSGNPTPTGTVTLSGGGYTSTAEPLSSGSYIFTIPANSLTAGSDTLSVSYSGDTNYAAATGTATVKVNALLTPTVVVTPAAATIDTADTLNVTATVSGSGATPTGTVKLSGGGYTSATATLSGGSYTFAIPANSLSAGADTLTVSYSGDVNYAAAMGSASVAVAVPLTPVVKVTPSATTVVAASALSVTAAVSGTGVTPTGTVKLSGGGYTSAAATLSGGMYTFAVPANSLTAGTDTLTVSYSGDSNYAAGTGTASITVSATPLTPTVTVTPAVASLDSGSSLSVTAAVSGAGVTPTGTVTLSGGGYTSTAQTLASGSYTFTIPANSLSAGADTLTVSYSGDTNYATGTGTASVTVTASVFTLSATNPAAISAGSSATSTVTVSTTTGYAGVVTLTCALTNSPTGATNPPTCSSGSSTVTLSSGATSGTTTVTVDTTSSNGTVARTEGRGWAGGAVLALLVLLGMPARRRRWRAMLGALALMAALGSLAACGGSSSATTAGSYTFTVTGTGNPSVSPAHTTTFTLTVN